MTGSQPERDDTDKTLGSDPEIGQSKKVQFRTRRDDIVSKKILLPTSG